MTSLETLLEADADASLVLDPLAVSPGVGLGELNDAAALQTRADRKYVLTVPQAAALLTAVAPGARVLEIGGIRSFGYESTYFDTPDLRAYTMAAHRRRRRFKVRTRTYLDTGTRYLEVKTRAARGRTVKERCLHDDDAHLGGDQAFVGERLARAGVDDVDPDLLAPVLRSRYHRTTVLLPRARLTVDTGLEWTSLTRIPGGAAIAGSVVVETKTDGAPCLADRVLWHAGHRPDRISKYATGMAVLDPDLPDAPWRRLLRRCAVTDLAVTDLIHVSGSPERTLQ